MEDAGRAGEGLFQRNTLHLSAGNLRHASADFTLPSALDIRLNAAVPSNKNTLHQLSRNIRRKLCCLLYDFIQGNGHNLKLIPWLGLKRAFSGMKTQIITFQISKIASLTRFHFTRPTNPMPHS